MIITFETSASGDEALYCLHAELCGSVVFIKNERRDLINNSNSYDVSVALDKKQLHDFIGALLHLQSKLNQNK